MAITQNEIARLKIILEADMSGLKTQFNEAASTLSSFADTVKKSIAPAAIAASIGAFALEIRNVVREAQQYGSEMSKMAERVAVGVEGLSMLVGSAEKLGIEAGTVQTALKRLSVAMFEAGQGSGDAKIIFEKTGITFRDVATGQMRPVMDVFLDIADYMQTLTDSTERTTFAMKLFGRGGEALVPVLIKGSAAIKEHGEEMRTLGNLVTPYIGAKARELGLAIHDIDEAITGFKRSIVVMFYPALIQAATTLGEWAAAFNTVKSYIPGLIDAVKSLALGITVYLVPGLLASEKALGLLAMGALRASVAVADLGIAMLSLVKNPLFLAAAAVAGIAFAWNRETRAVEDSRVAHETWAATLKTMTADALTKEREAVEASIADMQGQIAKKRKVLDDLMDSGTVFEQASAGKDLDTANRVLADLLQRRADIVDAYQKRLSKVEPPVTAGTEEIKTLKKKTEELAASYTSLVNPVKGARAQIQAFVDDLLRNKSVPEDVKRELDKMWAAYDKFAKEEWGRKLLAATTSANLSGIASKFHLLNTELEAEYAKGEIDLGTYFDRRREMISKQTAAEVSEMQKLLAKMPKGSPEAIGQQAAIAAKTAGANDEITKTIEQQRIAWRDLTQSVKDAGLQMRQAGTQGDMEANQRLYDAGLMSISLYYSKMKELRDRDLKDLTDNLRQKLASGISQQESEKVLQDLDLAKLRATLADKKAIWDEELALRQGNITKLQQTAMLAASSAASVPMSKGTAEEQAEKDYAAKKAEIEADYAQKIKGVTEMIVSNDQDAANKRLAIAQLQADQRVQIENAMQQKVKTVQEAALQNAAVVTQGMGQLFGQMYESTGGKMKAFFLLQKSMAIAEIIINTMVAASKAGAMLGPFGIAMSSWITAMGYAQAAMVAGVTVAGLKEGGPVRGPGTETSDSIPAYLSKGEYVHPARAVKYYGMDVMEAIRRMVIPREMLSGFGRFAVAAPGGGFANGGIVTDNFASREDRTPGTVSINNTWVFSRPDMRAEILENRSTIEHVMLDSLRAGGVLRDGVRRYR